jgi:hypothetical protein
MHMQTINKQKPSAGLARLHGVSEREMTSLAKFSSGAEAFGIRTTAISRGPLLGVGCRLQLSGKADYEVLISNGQVLLGKVEANGQRIRLAEGGSNIEASWEKLLQAVRNSEGRI